MPLSEAQYCRVLCVSLLSAECPVWGHQRGKLDLLGLEANSCGIDCLCLWIWLGPKCPYVGNHCAYLHLLHIPRQPGASDGSQHIGVTDV